MNVLILDDNELVRRALSLVLQGGGHQVTMAESWNAVLAVIEQADFRLDAAVVDFRVPDATGIEAARRLRRRQPDLPVVLITGASVDLDEIDDAISEGTLAAALQKPVLPAELLATLEQLVGSRKDPP